VDLLYLLAICVLDSRRRGVPGDAEQVVVVFMHENWTPFLDSPYRTASTLTQGSVVSHSISRYRARGGPGSPPETSNRGRHRSTTVEVSRLVREEFRVEIEATALVDS
jgi:hypothetical protein